MVSMRKLINAEVRIFDRIHILLDQIYISLGDGIILLGVCQSTLLKNQNYIVYQVTNKVNPRKKCLYEIQIAALFFLF